MTARAACTSTQVTQSPSDLTPGVMSISAVVAVSPSESRRVHAHVGALTGDCVTRVRASSLLVDADLIADPGESGETVPRASRRVLSDPL